MPSAVTLPATLARADEVRRPQPDPREKRIDAAITRRQRMGDLASPKPPYPGSLPLFHAADLDVPARATRHVLPKGRNFH